MREIKKFRLNTSAVIFHFCDVIFCNCFLNVRKCLLTRAINSVYQSERSKFFKQKEDNNFLNSVYFLRFPD